jgi:hypothetical protein
MGAQRPNEQNWHRNSLSVQSLRSCSEGHSYFIAEALTLIQFRLRIALDSPEQRMLETRL